MKFFADHCVPEPVLEALEAGNHEVVRLRSRLRTDAPDPEVIAEAEQLDAILLSLNGDFSDLIRYPPQEFGGIVTLQVKGPARGAATDRPAAGRLSESSPKPRALPGEVTGR